MNKIIFEIGLLAFCVASVVYGTQGDTLLDTVARAFIVFMIVVCGLAMLLFAMATLRSKGEPKRKAEPEQEMAQPPGRSDQSAHQAA
jgi:uncharacterized MAPEG superfamily protein